MQPLRAHPNHYRIRKNVKTINQSKTTHIFKQDLNSFKSNLNEGRYILHLFNNESNELDYLACFSYLCSIAIATTNSMFLIKIKYLFYFNTTSIATLFKDNINYSWNKKTILFKNMLIHTNILLNKEKRCFDVRTNLFYWFEDWFCREQSLQDDEL